jgi:hypothetical protein
MQPLLQWKNCKCYIFWDHAHSHRSPACNAHAPNFLMWPAWLYNIFTYYFIKGTIKRNILKWNVCSDFLYNFCLKRFSFWEGLSEIWSNMCIGLSDFSETGTFLTDFQKIIKCQLLSKSVPWDRSCSMWTDRQTWKSY